MKTATLSHLNEKNSDFGTDNLLDVGSFLNAPLQNHLCMNSVEKKTDIKDRAVKEMIKFQLREKLAGMACTGTAAEPEAKNNNRKKKDLGQLFPKIRAAAAAQQGAE